MRTKLAIVLAALIAVLTAGMQCNNPQPETPPPAGSWLVLLCKASDNPAEPHPKSYYETLFDRGQTDLLWSYFDAISNHTLDISGTRVQGWFDMSVTTDKLSPAVRNNAMPVTRSQTALDCRSSALGALAGMGIQVDPQKYAGIITVINVPVDSGAAGYQAVVLPAEADVAFTEHEMLHVLGLDHSFTTSKDTSADHVWNHGGDAEYNDCWDMMSFQTCVFSFASARGVQGPELQAAYRDRLKWLPAGRIWDGATVGPKQTITLAPLSDPSKTGFLLARIPLRDGEYGVEYREKSGFDRGIPGSTVLIRELRNAKTYLVRRQNNSATWLAGDRFTDTDNFVSVNVDNIVPGAATVTIDTMFAPAAAALGQKCGDKYHGQVLPCAAGLQCAPKHTPPLVSIDYFCQP